MLKNETEAIDLVEAKNTLLGEIPELIDKLGARRLDDDVVNIDYPVLQYPSKISSLNFDKTPAVSGILNGIKGQYLLLDSGVLNIRKFGSYHVTLSTL